MSADLHQQATSSFRVSGAAWRFTAGSTVFKRNLRLFKNVLKVQSVTLSTMVNSKPKDDALVRSHTLRSVSEGTSYSRRALSSQRSCTQCVTRMLQKGFTENI